MQVFVLWTRSFDSSCGHELHRMKKNTITCTHTNERICAGPQLGWPPLPGILSSISLNDDLNHSNRPQSKTFRIECNLFLGPWMARCCGSRRKEYTLMYIHDFLSIFLHQSPPKACIINGKYTLWSNADVLFAFLLRFQITAHGNKKRWALISIQDVLLNSKSAWQ